MTATVTDGVGQPVEITSAAANVENGAYSGGSTRYADDRPWTDPRNDRSHGKLGCCCGLPGPNREYGIHANHSPDECS